MWPNSQETADLVTLIEETRNGKLYFLCGVGHQSQIAWSIKEPQRFLQGKAVFKLMKRKGVYPFAYMDSSEKFEETKQPPENVF